MISIILPVMNEIRHGYLEALIEHIQSLSGDFEFIAVDGNSTDKTENILTPHAQVIKAGDSNRAHRMNIGAKEAVGDILLFHHPTSLLPNGALDSITKALEDENIIGGGFSHSFDSHETLLNFTSWYSNNIRGKRGVIYLDHCIFIRRRTFEEIGGFREVDIFEDTYLSWEMRKKGRTVILPDKIVTSPRRFHQRGILKQILLNLTLKLSLHMGVKPRRLNKIYEKKYQINVKY